MVSSTVKSEDDDLLILRDIYSSFAIEHQKYIKVNRQNFPNVFDEYIDDLDDNCEIDSIKLLNVKNTKIIKEWKGLNFEEFIPLYNEEIKSAILCNLTKNGDKLQIKIKVHEKVKEFVFWEFTVSGDNVEFNNCRFSDQKECYLDYFSKEVQSANHLYYYLDFYKFLSFFDARKLNVNNTTRDENIKISKIRTSNPSNLFYDMKNIKALGVFKFTDFNLSIKQSEELVLEERSPEKEIYIKPLTMFFEATKEIPKISFDVFVPVEKTGGRHALSEKVSIEILKDEKVTYKVGDNLGFSLMELQEEIDLLKVILGRPTGETKNPIKPKDSLSIEFMNMTADTKFPEILFNAEEKIEGDFTYTTFTIKEDEGDIINSNLFDVMTAEICGLVSITLNGQKGIIGTYGFHSFKAGIYYCMYSDKLISLPSFGTNQNVVQNE